MGELKSEEGDRKQKKKTNKKRKALVDPWVWKERRRGGEGAAGGGEVSVRRNAPSDRQRHKAVVLLDVAFEDVWAGTQDTLKARPIELDALQGAAGNHGGGAGAVHQQSNLTWGKKKTSVTDLKFKIHENILQCHTQRHVYRNSVGHSHKDLFFHHF